MDVDIVIQKAESILRQAHNYKSIEAQKTAIEGAPSGSLVVNEQSLPVEGDGFDNLLEAKVVHLGGTMGLIKIEMDELCDEIIVEIATL